MKKMLTYFCFAALALSAVKPACAQMIPGEGEDKIIVTPNTAPGRTMVKLSIISPLEAKNTIRAAAEMTIGTHWSIQPELGVIYNYNSGTYKLQPGYLNFEQRLGFRYYIPEKFLNGLYLGPLLSYSQFNYRKGAFRNLNPSYPDSTWFADYSEATVYDEKDYALYATGGIQLALNKHFALDLCVGIGMQYEDQLIKFNPGQSKTAHNPAENKNISYPGLLAINVGYIF